MDAIREPRSVQAATALLEQYADLDGQIALVEAARNESIAAINARSDAAANDLIERRATIREKVEAWWAKQGKQLLPKGRKSMELGGCTIGSKAGRAALVVDGDEDAAAAVLAKRKWGKDLVRIRTSLNKAAVVAALGGANKAQLKKLGIALKPGVEVFILERPEQGGTRGGESPR